MRRKICGVIFFSCILSLIGIAGGIEQGGSLSVAIWCLPIFLIMTMSFLIGGFYHE